MDPGTVVAEVMLGALDPTNLHNEPAVTHSGSVKKKRS